MSLNNHTRINGRHGRTGEGLTLITLPYADQSYADQWATRKDTWRTNPNPIPNINPNPDWQYRATKGQKSGSNLSFINNINLCFINNINLCLRSSHGTISRWMTAISTDATHHIWLNKATCLLWAIILSMALRVRVKVGVGVRVKITVRMRISLGNHTVDD